MQSNGKGFVDASKFFEEDLVARLHMDELRMQFREFYRRLEAFSKKIKKYGVCQRQKLPKLRISQKEISTSPEMSESSAFRIILNHLYLLILRIVMAINVTVLFRILTNFQCDMTM